jgi:multidrug transporter EmrE-like cation transporter
VLFAANVLVYRKALEHLDISVAYPVMVSGGLILVTVAAIAMPALSEKISIVQALGILLIAAGVWCVVGAGGPASS